MGQVVAVCVNCLTPSFIYVKQAGLSIENGLGNGGLDKLRLSFVCKQQHESFDMIRPANTLVL